MYHIIINPIAGRGRTLRHLPLLVKLFGDNNIAHATHTTEGVMDGYEKAKSCAGDAECKGIIGIGGDGTFQEIAAGMLDAFPGAAGTGEPGTDKPGKKIPVPLAIFPAGSGNDFIMSLEGGKKAALAMYSKNTKKNVRVFFEKFMRNKLQAIDIITANGMAFLNVGNVGLDRRIVYNAGVLKEKYGRRAYYAAVYKSIAQHKNLPLVIEVNGETLDKHYTLVAACNGQYYGGGMRIAPAASHTDGKITLCVIEAMSRPKIMLLFPSLMMEKHGSLKAVSFVECESLKILLPGGAETLCLDGNLYPAEGQIEFKILPKALDVFI